MRCAWCEREATAYLDAEVSPPCCEAAACVRASGEAFDAVERHRDALAGRLSDEQLRAAEAQATERDARELRGEPPSMEGWLLFDGSAP